MTTQWTPPSVDSPASGNDVTIEITPPVDEHDQHHHSTIETHMVDGDESGFEINDEEGFYIPQIRSTKWWKDVDFIKLFIMLSMVILFFLAELVVGILGRSLALLADAFHMLSDAISLVIGLSAILLAKKKESPKFSYGFERAETIGGLINSVFLLSAVLFICLETFERFREPEFIKDAWLVFGVGTGGLVINLIGMIMFCGHSHGGHGHSHGGGHGHSHAHADEETQGHSHAHSEGEMHEHNHQHNHEHNHQHDHEHNHQQNHEHDHSHSQGNQSKKRKKRTRSHNMLGVFLHVFGDFLGSIGVVIAAILNLIFVEGKDEAAREAHRWVMYVDPALSLIMAMLILITALPLVYGTSKILLQSVPESVNITKLRDALNALSGVQDIHDLHVWSIAHGKKLIGSCHLTLDDSFDIGEWPELALKAKEVFHTFGVHSTTIQPERLSLPKRRKFDENVEICNMVCSTQCDNPTMWTVSGYVERKERNIRYKKKKKEEQNTEIKLDDLDDEQKD